MDLLPRSPTLETDHGRGLDTGEESARRKERERRGREEAAFRVESRTRAEEKGPVSSPAPFRTKAVCP